MAELLRVGDLANQLGVTRRTIRYYEVIGLLRPVERGGNGYRYYDQASTSRLRQIRRLQDVGFSLAQIRQIIEICGHDGETFEHDHEFLYRLHSRLEQTDAKISKLRALRSELIDTIGKLASESNCIGHESVV